MKTLNKFKFVSLFLILLFGANQLSAQCQASFTYTDMGNGVIGFSNISAFPDSSVFAVWEMGDGSYATGDNPSQTFYNGWYEVCLTINDTIFGGTCTSTICDSIEVTSGIAEPIDSCTIDATYTVVNNGNGVYSFTSSVTGGIPPYSYSWQFGDGTYSSINNPVHTYANDDSLNVCLTVIDSDTNCSSVYCESLMIIGNPCIINVNLNGRDSLQYGVFEAYNVSVNCFWDFGDGEVSSDSSNYQEHFYSSPGTYYYCVTIGNCPPICDSIIIREECDFNVYASYSVSGGDVAFFAEGTGLNDFWDFGDGNSNIGKDVSHTYSSPGTYNYCFTRDSCAPICGSIVIPTYCESNPVYSNFYISNNGNGNFVINNYSSSGNGETYFWEFSDGSTSTSQNPNFTFIEDGLLCLTVVNDSLCEAVFCDSVIVSCNLASGFSYTDNGNGNYSFANTSSGGFDAFSWSFGDGYTSSAMNPNHTFASNGIYTVVLAIADSIGGCMDYFTSTINVVGVSNPLLCNAGFSVYTDSISNGVNVVNSSTGSNLTYFWDFGDGNTSTQAYPSYTYSTAGPFELCLTVSSDSLCTSTYCDSIGAGGVVLKGGGFTINVIQPVVTAINENVELISDLMIYPNPFQNNVTISLDLLKETQVNVSVTDLLGNVIAIIANREMNGTNKLQWNAEGVSGGIYLLNVRTENALKVEKLILNR